MYPKNLSTGVLAKDPTTLFAGINLANLDPLDSLSISVFVNDWSSGSPVPLEISLSNPITLLPNTSRQVTSDLLGVSFYEIRFITPVDNDLIINCYGLTALPFVIGLGNTILHHELMEPGLV